MITLTSKQTQIYTILVSLLLGLIRGSLAEAFIVTDVLSQEQAGTVLAIDKVTVQGTERLQEKFAITRRTPYATCSYSSAIPFYGKMSFILAKTAQAQLFIPRVRGDSPGWIDALQIQPRSTVVETFGWQIRSADRFRRWLHPGHSTEVERMLRGWKIGIME